MSKIRQALPGEQAYRYSAFCEKYRAWAKRLKRSMRQVPPGGERLFVDYAGQTMPVVDVLTGEIRRAQVFVAVLGASNYTYACATWQQTAADWVGAIIAALGFIVHRLADAHNASRVLTSSSTTC